ncbi:hypothetical protein D3C86_1037970 [compost metagenome]
MGADKAIGKGERIKKAGTGPSEIDRAGSDEAQPVCEQRRRGWQKMIRCRSCKQRQRDLGGANFRIFQRHAAGSCGKAAQRVTLLRPITRADAGAPLDPAGLQPEAGLYLGIIDTS